MTTNMMKGVTGEMIREAVLTAGSCPRVEKLGSAIFIHGCGWGLVGLSLRGSSKCRRAMARKLQRQINQLWSARK
ncbi:hypothetical protein D3C78_552910 [compost metagenome]